MRRSSSAEVDGSAMAVIGTAANIVIASFGANEIKTNERNAQASFLYTIV